MAASTVALKDMSRREIDAVFTGLYPSVKGVCQRILGDVPAVEDLTQKTFLLAWEHRERFRSEASPSTWIHIIARNASIGFLRLSSTQRDQQFAEVYSTDGEYQGYEEDFLLSRGLNQFEQVARRELNAEAWRLLERSLRRCPDYYATIFFLHYRKDMRLTEIAVELDRNLSTIKVAVHRTWAVVKKDPYLRHLRSPFER